MVAIIEKQNAIMFSHRIQRPIRKIQRGTDENYLIYSPLARAHFDRRAREDELQALGLPVPEDQAAAGGGPAVPAAAAGAAPAHDDQDALEMEVVDAMADEVMALAAGGEDLLNDDDNMDDLEVDDTMNGESHGLDETTEEAVAGTIETLAIVEGVVQDLVGKALRDVELLFSHRYRRVPTRLVKLNIVPDRKDFIGFLTRNVEAQSALIPMGSLTVRDVRPSDNPQRMAPTYQESYNEA